MFCFEQQFIVFSVLLQYEGIITVGEASDRFKEHFLIDLILCKHKVISVKRDLGSHVLLAAGLEVDIDQIFARGDGNICSMEKSFDTL